MVIAQFYSEVERQEPYKNPSITPMPGQLVPSTTLIDNTSTQFEKKRKRGVYPTNPSTYTNNDIENILPPPT